MSDMTEGQLVEVITHKLMALRGADFAAEFERNGLEDWNVEVDRVLSGEQPMTPSERLAIGVYVEKWRSLRRQEVEDKK